MTAWPLRAAAGARSLLWQAAVMLCWPVLIVLGLACLLGALAAGLLSLGWLALTLFCTARADAARGNRQATEGSQP